MTILTPGHVYALEGYENPELSQTLKFINKVEDPHSSGNFITVHDGTTNEDVLEMLINRLRFLNQKLPSRQTALAITKAEECLFWLQDRTRERKLRGVEGTNKP